MSLRVVISAASSTSAIRPWSRQSRRPGQPRPRCCGALSAAPLAAEAEAGVRHHVCLSIVGTDRTPDNGYFRDKVAQEKLIEASGIPYTIVRAT